MAGRPIAHIGVLVADLEAAREHWSRALELPFSPISRYRPANWSDLGSPEPHLHDARLTFYLGDGPSFEILEFVGIGTHSPEKGEGGHHLSFPPLDDLGARRAELSEFGIGADGEIWHDGRWILTFGEAGPLDNVYTEWVEEHPDHPDVKDDLSPIGRMPDGTKTLFPVETMLELGGTRPFSGIVEIGITVADIATAVGRWNAVTGYEFSPTPEGSWISGYARTRLRLTQREDGERLGVASAVVVVERIDAQRERLRDAAVPFVDHPPTGIAIDPAFLNGFTIRFQERPEEGAEPWSGTSN